MQKARRGPWETKEIAQTTKGRILKALEHDTKDRPKKGFNNPNWEGKKSLRLEIYLERHKCNMVAAQGGPKKPTKINFSTWKLKPHTTKWGVFTVSLKKISLCYQISVRTLLKWNASWYFYKVFASQLMQFITIYRVELMKLVLKQSSKDGFLVRIFYDE